jgi:hypothetical protein
MGYPSRHYLDSMANLYHSNKFYNDAFSNNENPFNDTARDREAFWRAEFQEFQPIMQTMLQEMRQTREMMERMLMGPIRNHRYNDTHVDYGIRVRHTRHQRLAPINQPPVYEDLSDDDVSCVQPVSNHIYEFPNRKPIYEDNVSYGKKMELSLEKQYVQPQPLVPTTVPVEEYPPQAQLITITTEINDNGDSFKEDNQVEGDIKKKIFGEIIIEGDKKETSCLGTIYIDFSKYLSPEEPHAIYVDFFKYLSLEEPRVIYRKENSRTSFFQVGVSDVGRNLIIFSVQTKIEEMPKIILKQSRLIKKFTCFQTMEVQKERLDIQTKSLFYFISLLELRLYFLYSLGLDLLYVFLFLLE